MKMTYLAVLSALLICPALLPAQTGDATTPAEIAKHNNLLISLIFCLRI